MVKRKQRAKRSLSSLPKGLPVRNSRDRRQDGVNPFEVTSRNKRPKHEVVNRPTPKVSSQSALARALQERQTKLRQELKRSKKSNSFLDRRIGANDQNLTAEQQNLARLVRERARRSKRSAKYSLEDDDDDAGEMLTHRGRTLDSLTAKDHVILSDDELDDGGQLDPADTMLHFGGGNARSAAESNPYGPSGGIGDRNTLVDQYSTRKQELDDLIMRRKLLKAERVKTKEAQVDAFEKMDEAFDGLAELLNFRDKEKEIQNYHKSRREGTLSADDKDMDDWDKEMRGYQFLERKVAATDRTKTPEEIAKEEAERLNELETRRLARMNGEYVDDDFSDISDDENNNKRKKARLEDNPERLDGDSDDDDEDESQLQTRFTADGLVHVDKNGVVVGKVGESKQDTVDSEQTLLAVGDRVTACYRATEQFDGQVTWYNGVINKIHRGKDGSKTYDVDYDDGDFEDGVQSQHIRPIEKTSEEVEKEESNRQEEQSLKLKQRKATEKARTEMPFVFEVPTTLDALHDMIGEHAKTGEDASLVIERIYASNSVRLDRRNTEKMQNFYDVLLRRFVAVGDAISQSGDGGAILGRYSQLDALTQTLYKMAQDAPDSAGAVWARRLGIFHSAHAKRLRDGEMEQDEDFTAWPSTGTLLVLKALGHIFPVTDRRHYVVTPTFLLLGQFIAHTPVYSLEDLTKGIFSAGLLIEYTVQAKRCVPEAYAFLAGVVRLFAAKNSDRRAGHACANLASAAEEKEFLDLRRRVYKVLRKDTEKEPLTPPSISLETDVINGADTPAGILFASLSLLEVAIRSMAGSIQSAERELFAEVSESVLALSPKDKMYPLSSVFVDKISQVVSALSDACQYDTPRVPLHRRAAIKKQQVIQSLAPRMENPEKYSLSKDKGKGAAQVAADRMRRELKREKKAISRELRLDAAFVESERRSEQSKKDAAAKAKRNRAHAWLQSEQATMNQQVAQGGGLLSGGGMGAARAKAKTAKLGIKRGGKL